MTAFGTRKDRRVYPKRDVGKAAADRMRTMLALAEELKKTQEQVTEFESRLKNGDAAIGGALDEQNAKVMKIVAEIRRIRQRQGLAPN